MFSKTIFASILAATTFAAEGVYDYKLNGADWGKTVPLCGTGKEQSPIDLNDNVAVISNNLEIKGESYPNFVV